MSDGPAPDGYGHAWHRSADGLRLHARVYGRRGPGGRDVVCLSGLTRNAAEFDGVAHALLAAGAADRVVALDYRGRGLSDHDPDPSRYAIPVELADAVAAMDAEGVRDAVLIGVSRGGLIGIVLGPLRPDLLAGLVLVDIGPVVERAGLLRIKGYVGRLAPPADLEAGAAALRARFGDQFPNLIDADWLDWAGTTWFPDGAGGLRLTYDPALARTLDGVDATSPIPHLWEPFGQLAGRPVLAIRGGLSDLLSAETLRAMAARHPGLETVTVPDEGHTPLLARPALAERIGAFCRRAFAGAQAQR